MLFISATVCAPSLPVLARSERLDRSQVVGQRKAEACAINQSLSSLWGVFGALAARAKHVPYRDSKLTYLLQPCLSPGGKALMFVHVSPEQVSVDCPSASLMYHTHCVHTCPKSVDPIRSCPKSVDPIQSPICRRPPPTSH